MFITHLQYHILKQTQLYPDSSRTFKGRVAEVKNQMLKDHFITHMGGMKYQVTDLGMAKMEEYERKQQS